MAQRVIDINDDALDDAIYEDTSSKDYINDDICGEGKIYNAESRKDAA